MVRELRPGFARERTFLWFVVLSGRDQRSLRFAGGGPWPAVVMLHGFTGNRAESHRIFVEMARMLALGGIASLRFDFRGSGDSGGEFSAMTISGECRDARQALAYLRKRKEVDAERIGLLGMSMGGLVAAMTMAEDPHVKAVALWSAVAHPAWMTRHIADPAAKKQLAQDGFLDLGGWAVGHEFFDEAAQLVVLDKMSRVASPVLLVHGSEDASVPVWHANDYETALRNAGQRVHKHIIQGASHTFSSIAWEAEVLALTFSWFDGLLRGHA